MADPTFIKRAQPHSHLMTGGRSHRGLGSWWAFTLTGLILVAVFGATFFINPDRPAAADDPAYYTWRTETLLANEPDAMLGITGPLDMYSSGYRVVTPVLGALLRRIGDFGQLTPTIIIAVGLRVLIPLLLAGFAYRHRKDPLIWHAVAFASASLLVSPPFGGYLDNVMTLLFLTASLYFLEPSRTRWSARLAFFVLLLLSGLTHPTTLAIFCVVLGAMSVVRLLFRRFDLRSVVRDDAPMLVAALLAAVSTYVIWKVGIWGPAASLSEAALPPPAGAGFFKTRLNDWVTALRPAVNLPLFLIGFVGLVAAGRRAAEDELARVGVVWLAPLAGILGVFAGLAYPYYRFFNTTLAWVLLIGLGAYFLARFFLDIAARGGIAVIAVLGLVGIGVLLAGNFQAGLDKTNWNDPSDAWVKPDERAALDALRAYLDADKQGQRPIIFVADNEAAEEVRIYGFAKLVGNVSRYGVPGELQDRTAYYLGSLDAFLDGEPTDRDPYYRDLSSASLEDALSIAPELSRSALVVVADVFNESGSNTGIIEEGQQEFEGADVALILDGRLITSDGTTFEAQGSRSDGNTFSDALRALLAAALMLLPGLLLVRLLLPGASSGETIAMVPVLGTSLLVLVTVFQLAVTDSPLTAGQAWLALGITAVISAAALVVGSLGGGPLENETYASVGP